MDPNNNSNSEDPKQRAFDSSTAESKRRSLLPQRRALQHHHQQQQQRQHDSNSDNNDVDTPTPSTAGPAPSRTKAVQPNTSTSRLARSASLRQPNNPALTSSSAASSMSSHSSNAITTTRGHVRHASNISKPRPRSVFGLDQLSELRAPAEPETALKSPTASSFGGLKRSASTTTRGRGGANVSSLVRPTATAPVLKSDLGTNKPQFSTFQQHFSPKKTVPTATTPVELTTQVLSPELVALQNELLQLALLHRGCQATMGAWEGSAKRKLKSRFESVGRKDQQVRKMEGEAKRTESLRGLTKWSEGLGEGAMEEVLRGVADSVRVVEDLTHPDGRLNRCVKRFERWFGQASSTSEGAGMDRATDLLIVAPLPKDWFDDVDYCQRKLELCTRELDNCGAVPDENSGLARIVSGHRALVAANLEELRAMGVIEAAVTKRQREDVKTKIDVVLSRDTRGVRKQGQIRHGVWKA